MAVRVESLITSRQFGLYIALATLVASILVGVVISSQRTPSVLELDSAKQELIDLTTKSTVTLRDFSRSETKDGKLVWEVKAKGGEFYPSSSLAELQSPSVLFFDNEHKPIKLDAPKGQVNIEADYLKQAVVNGGARIVHSSGLTITSEAFTFANGVAENGSGEVTSNTETTLATDTFETVGKNFTFLVGPQTIKFHNGVKTTFVGKAAPSSPAVQKK